MVAGKSGYFDITGESGFSFRVNWSETYDTATNKSIVSVDNLTIKSTTHTGIWYMNGEVSVNGVAVGTLSSGNPVSHSASIWNFNQWIELTLHDSTKAFPWKSGEIIHDADGSKDVTISVSIQLFKDYNTVQPKVSGSATVALTTIPRASEITDASDVTLGNHCGVTWTPMAAAFRYRLKFSMGDWSHTTGSIHPGHTTDYTYSGYVIPLEVAEQIPDSRTGEMAVELFTYSDADATVQIGGASCVDIWVTVPDSDATRPTVSMTLTPVSALPESFHGLYIQGKTKVKAELEADGKYGAAIESYSMKAEAETYDAKDSFTSGYLATNGESTVTGYATDSRGITGSVSERITVLPYIKPKILTVGGEDIAARCDAGGNLISSGTYLKIKAKRSYSLITYEGVQYNHCKIQFRYKLANAESYSDWVTILEGNSLTSDEVETEPLLGGVLSARSTYVVEVRVIDDVGEAGYTTIHIPTDTVYMHRTKNALGLGKYVEGENLLDVAWDAHFRGEVRLGETGMTLKEYILAVISEGG